MLIEKDARRHIVKAIEAEKEIKIYEITEKLKGRVVIRSPAYDKLRSKFVGMCCQLNSIANTEGKGRDDFTIDILLAAEDTLRKVSSSKSKAVRKLAEHIKTSFINIRVLLRKYGSNIELVDPQLKNNPELTEALLAFEKSWEKGKYFLLNTEICDMLITFSQLIEGLIEKYKEIQEKIESMDTDIFMIIPSLTLLNNLDADSKSSECLFFTELGISTHDQETIVHLRDSYKRMKEQSDGFQLYNIIERAILDKKGTDEELTQLGLSKEDLEKLLQGIKKGAVTLQRSKPVEWNTLMETAMGII